MFMEFIIIIAVVLVLAALVWYIDYDLDVNVNKSVYGEVLTDDEIKPYYDLFAEHGYVHSSIATSSGLISLLNPKSKEQALTFIAKPGGTKSRRFSYYINEIGLVPRKSVYTKEFDAILADPERRK